ncbi:MAG: hypothetical protein ACTSRZ_10610 [Promethearchaeota archaeon]
MNIYLARNSTHLLIALKKDNDYYYKVNEYRELFIYLDEGNDGRYGSGSRDGIATVYQDDIKA